ncbi:hypothetical protein [Streptomyces sp. WAC06614]|uniref:hypothetical protein n=1 Tax=Streptomyces sp. WAC06614 TaxID=2487416 RepID=UPI000F785C97|nr:hypothetical protein [Streptomyces sp. WAC06614]RSS82440.1 hypothetical protein EF918_06910 [Streptomyces sp. WAC06614]
MDRRILPDRGRRWNRVNGLLCTLAVLGTVVGGWSLYDSYGRRQERQESRAVVETSCAGLVDATAVLRLSGGADRVTRAGSSRVDLGRPSSGCLLDTVRAVDGDRRTIRHFSLTVRSRPDPLRAGRLGEERVGDEAPFSSRGIREREDATARLDLPNRLPLGDGAPGDHGVRSVSVVAACRAPAPSGITSILVTASSGEAVGATEAELGSVGRLARDAAVEAARRVGCEAEIPALPDRLPLPALALGPAESAQGTCAWYAAAARAGDPAEPGRERLPDRAAGAPTAAHGRVESCVLAVGPERVRRVLPGLGPGERQGQDVDRALDDRPWWIRTYSAFGDDADEALVTARLSPRPIPELGAGRSQDGEVLFGSATCAGRPAAFSLHTPPGYRAVLGDARLGALFAAYATETAQRRGCTGLKLPGAAGQAG